MGVERLEIIERSAYLNGESFGQVGAYERIDAVARYAVDPTNVANAAIVDLALVERGDDGLVRFDGDVTVLRPINQAGARRAALVEIPNRGWRVAGELFNRAPFLVEPTEQIDPGDGFLFRHGWTLAWCGWQWDVPRSQARMGLTAPHVIDASGEPETGAVQLRLQLHERVPSIDLTDHHVGLIGGHTTLPTADVNDPQALLLRREGLWGPAVEIPRQLWRFAKDDGAGNPIPDPGHVWLAGGFEPGRIYDLVYRTVPCRVAGVGLAKAFAERHPARSHPADQGLCRSEKRTWGNKRSVHPDQKNAGQRASHTRASKVPRPTPQEPQCSDQGKHYCVGGGT